METNHQVPVDSVMEIIMSQVALMTPEEQDFIKACILSEEPITMKEYTEKSKISYMALKNLKQKFFKDIKAHLIDKVRIMDCEDINFVE